MMFWKRSKKTSCRFRIYCIIGTWKLNSKRVVAYSWYCNFSCIHFLVQNVISCPALFTVNKLSWSMLSSYKLQISKVADLKNWNENNGNENTRASKGQR